MRRSRLVSAFALATVLTTALVGCGKAPPQLPPPEPPTVSVTKPRTVPMSPTKEFTGRLATKDPVKVIPQVSGRLVAREFHDSDAVEGGKTVLFRIDPVLFQADVASAKADIAKANADIANWTAQKIRDKAEFERVKKTVETGNGAQTDLDKADANLKIADAQIKVSEAARQSAEAALVKAQENLNYCTIYAPTTGRVGQALVAPGSIMEAYKTEMVSVFPVAEVYAFWEVDELTSLWYRDQINTGRVANPLDKSTPLKVCIRLKNEKDFNPKDESRNSEVNYADLEIARGTGTKTIRATFKNPEKKGPDGKPLLPPLSAGDSVRVRVSAGNQQPVLTVPESVVFSQQRKQYVYVVEGGKAELREIEPGAAFDGLIEVNRRTSAADKSGLDESDTVIADNLLRVRPGIPVTVK